VSTVAGATRTDPDAMLALLATGAVAAGCVLALAGAAGGATMLALAGAVAAGAGVVVLMASGLLSAALVIAVAAPLPALYTSGTTRLATVAPVAAGALVAWIIRRGVDRGSLQLGALPRRALLLLVGAFILATLLADDVALSARETLNFLLLAGLLLAITDELTSRPALRTQLVDLLVLSAGACGVLGVMEGLGVIPGDFPRWGTPFHRAALGFGQPNGLGFFLAALLPLAAFRFSASRGAARLLSAAALAAASLGLVATFSRASWVAALAGVGVLALAGQRRLALRIGALVLLGGVAVELIGGGIISDTVARTIGDWVVEQRAALFIAAVQMFIAHPITGIGPGGFADQVRDYAARITQLWDYQDTPHNAYIQMAAETGVVGLIAFCIFFGACLLLLLRTARRSEPGPARALRLALLSSFAIVMVASLGIWPFAHGTGEVVVLLLALAFSDPGVVA
jgi:O-antigen ligase